jgi:S1-C subfamily serine protease
MRAILYALVAAMLISLFGCGPSVSVKQVESREPLVPKVGGTKPIMFKKIVFLVPRGKIIGDLRAGTFCSYRGPLCWKDEKANISDVELGDVFRERLEKTGYTVVGDPDALFDDGSAERAELLIAGRIKDVRSDVCFPRARSSDWITAQGGVYLEIEWELYSKRARDVVLRATTRGSATGTEKSLSYQDIFFRAFDVAVRNLLANEGFYRQVSLGTKQPDRHTAENEPTDIKVRYRTVKEGSRAKADREGLLAAMRGSVVTVFSGPGHGSGFLISEDGYLLTNEHVVGGARFVNVKFVTGREVTGQVVRVNKSRDVALVKLEKDIYPSLAIGDTSTVNVGEEVYTIGTPLSADLCQTVTRGIVSSFRMKDNVKYVQSDVNIHPGNSGGPLVSLDKGVIGVCVSGMTFGPYTLGINYFIPVEEAIKALGITPALS